MSAPRTRRAKGPFRAEQVPEGSDYELSEGHLIPKLPARGQRARRKAGTALVLSTDPDVTDAGVDAGYSPADDVLRAPDVSIGNVPDAPGWIPGAPALAVEYADASTDELDLKTKIRELIAGGTQFVWVVRLSEFRRVEVYRPNEPMRVASHDEELTAPGILRNPVPVEALYDEDVARDIALRNLLQRKGFET